MFGLERTLKKLDEGAFHASVCKITFIGAAKTLHRNWSEVEHALRRPDKGSAVTSVVCGLGFEQYEDENLPRSGSSVSKSEETPGDLLTWLVGQRAVHLGRLAW